MERDQDLELEKGFEIRETEMEEIGYVIGESTPFKVIMLSKTPPKVGEYVIVKHDEDYLLGMVEESIAGNPFIPEDMTNLSSFENWRKIVEARNYTRGGIRILTKITPLLKGKRFEPTRTPPKPSYQVFRASDEVLRKIFLPPGLSGDDPYYYSETERKGYVRIGVLANHQNVPVYINVDSLVSRHAAILAVTGAGKSNTVSVLAERMVEGLGATVLLFDMHSEYSRSEIAEDRKNVIKPKINPLTLTIWELQKLAKIREDAIKQQSVLRYIYKSAKSHIAEIAKERPEELVKFDVIEYMIKVLECLDYFSEKKPEKRRNGKPRLSSEEEEEEFPNEECGDLKDVPKKLEKDVILNVANKLEDLKDLYKDVLSNIARKSVQEIVLPGHLNIVDLGEIDDVGSDVIASYLLRRILEERKAYLRSDGIEGYPVPVYIFLEEAHILVPKESESLTKEVVSRIAREGRKFGVGICLVSQRPKSIDESSLSQTNNKIILKIVEPNDLRYVQNSSELLSDELLKMLPSLRTGEAILLGEFTKLPALVKIDEHRGKGVGRDLNVAELWLNRRREEVSPEESRREIEEMMYKGGDL
ncbi:MAG: helicase HerA-like domain-containing protein [Fervidicoccaceae archaeon]|jgi:DNA helicase HerA-like ATPase